MAFSRISSATPSSFIVTGRPNSQCKPKTSSSFSSQGILEYQLDDGAKATFSP